MKFHVNIADWIVIFFFPALFYGSVTTDEPNTFLITDDSPPGHRLGRITHFNGDLNTPLVAGLFKAVIVRSNRPPASYFSIDENNGDLFTKILMDREVLCIESEQSAIAQLNRVENGVSDCHFQFQVAVYTKTEKKLQWSSVPDFIDVRVILVDRNDHVPTFYPQRQVNLSILESAPIGTRIQLPLAVDLDSTEYAVSRYEISPSDNNEWSLYQQSKEFVHRGSVRHEIVGLYLELRTTLDRENTASYAFEIKAFDSPHETSVFNENRNTLKVIVNVDDVNDNGPVFQPQHGTIVHTSDDPAIVTYFAEIAESEWLRTPLLQLKAIDVDSLKFAITRYDFPWATESIIKSTFKLEETTGDLFLRQPLDYETKDSYNFHVCAIDVDHERKIQSDDAVKQLSVTSFQTDVFTSTARVIIKVIDTNDEVPVIEMDYLRTDHPTKRPSTYAKITENNELPQFIADILVTDRDTHPSNNHVICHVKNPDMVYDNRNVNYFQLRNPEQLFQLNEVRRHPGQVQYNLLTTGPIDRENLSTSSSVLHVGITCTDSGQPPRSAQTAAVIKVQDLNDNAPQMRLLNPVKEDGNCVEIFENSPVGTLVAKLNVTDDDIDRNGYVTCHIKERSNIGEPKASEYFHIDPVSCELSVYRMIDREMNDMIVEKIVVTIVAEDHGEPPNMTQMDLCVRILDQNDNAPMLQQPYYRFNIEENLKAGTSVGQIVVQDRDRVYENIMFKFQKQEVGPFSLWPSKVLEYGTNNQGFLVCYINTTKPLDREIQESYEFVVLVVDSPNLKKHTDNKAYQDRTYTVSATVLVTVIDVNDNDPSIIFPQQANKTFRLSNGEKKNYQLLTVNANDRDSLSDPFLFRLVKEDSPKQIMDSQSVDIDPRNYNSFLDIDSNAGIVYLIRDMNINDTGLHAFHVTVQDNDAVPRSVSLRFLVLVEAIPPRSNLVYHDPVPNNGIISTEIQRSKFDTHAMTKTFQSSELKKRLAIPRFTGDAILILSLGLILLLLLATLCLVIYARRSQISRNESSFCWSCIKLRGHRCANKHLKNIVQTDPDNNNISGTKTGYLTVPHKDIEGSVASCCNCEQRENVGCNGMNADCLDQYCLRTVCPTEHRLYHDCSKFNTMHSRRTHDITAEDEYMALQSATGCHECVSPMSCPRTKFSATGSMGSTLRSFQHNSTNVANTTQLSPDSKVQCLVSCNIDGSRQNMPNQIATETV